MAGTPRRLALGGGALRGGGDAIKQWRSPEPCMASRATLGCVASLVLLLCLSIEAGCANQERQRGMRRIKRAT
jgi:hypothetical protein